MQRAISRRGVLSGIATNGAGSFIPGTSSLVDPAEGASDRSGFDPVAANSADIVTVPNGYRWQAAFKRGDPPWSDAPEFDAATRGAGASQECALGDNNDGMAVFSIGSRQVLVADNEHTTLGSLYGNRDSLRPEPTTIFAKAKRRTASPSPRSRNRTANERLSKTAR